MVREHMQRVQAEQAWLYNRDAQVREFHIGERVMVLVPTNECKFLARWHGPYEVIERMGPVNYKVRQPVRRRTTQTYHVNLLKHWHEPVQVTEPAFVSVCAPQISPKVALGEQLTQRQHQDLQELVDQNRDVFLAMPGRTTLISHDIKTKPGKKVRLRPYWIPEARRQAIREEVQKMLQLGVIEESHNACSSPVVLVPKPDGSWRFCNDFRRFCNECLGPARFLGTLDLTRGYWKYRSPPR